MKHRPRSTKRLSWYITLLLFASVFAEPAAADSIIRITGDTTSSTSNSSGNLKEKEPLSTAGGKIRIIGDKKNRVRVPSAVPSARPEPVPAQPPAKEALDGKDQKGAVAKKALPPAASGTVADKAPETKTPAGEKIRSEEIAARADQERAVKAEQEKKATAEAARQTAMQLEQNLAATRKAEESRKTAEKGEQDRIAALKADEERRAAGAGASAIWDRYLSARSPDPEPGRSEARRIDSKTDSDLLMFGLLPRLNSTVQTSQICAHCAPADAPSDISSLDYNVAAQSTLLHVPTIYSLAAPSSGRTGVSAARQNVMAKFSDSYFALLKAHTDKQIALGETNRLKQTLDQSLAFFKAGAGDIISVYEAQSRLDEAGADLSRSESNLRLAEQKLSAVTGKPVTPRADYLPQQAQPDNLEWWIAHMKREQPVINQHKKDLSKHPSNEQR